MNSLSRMTFRILLCLFLTSALYSEDAPNFLLILTDDQGWSQLSDSMVDRDINAMSTYLETPNMNRLGASGIRFSSGYAPAPLCTPTRRSIQCGTTAARSGSEFKSSWVPADHLTIPKALKQANPDYRCAHFGKWGEQMISTPEDCGYDKSDGETGNATGGMPNTLNPDKKGANHNNTEPFYIDNEDPKLTKSVTESAVDFMKEQSGAGHPFYVQTSFYAQHLSVVCSEAMLRKYKEKGTPDRGYTEAWAAMMEELDNGVGRLLDTIDELGIKENTYVVFMADNGGRGTVPGGDESRLPTNVPLTGAKHSLYEGGIRVPFMIAGPGIAGGQFCGTPVAGYDLLPTFYALAGGAEPLPEEVDGVSLKPLFENVEAKLERPDKALFFHRPGKRFSAIRMGHHKLMLFWDGQGNVESTELYVVSKNPQEEGRDIASENPQKVKNMQNRLLAYLDRVGAETVQSIPKKRKKKK